MFIGINNTNRRRILREALTAKRDMILGKANGTQADVDDLDHINSLLREINAAESLGTKPPTYDAPTHYGDR